MKAYQDIPIDPWHQRLLHTLEFVSDAPAFFAKQMRKHGDTYRCMILGKEYVRAHGPDVVQLIFKNSDDAIQTGVGWQPVLNNFFPNGLLLKDGKNHITHRRIMQHAFNKPAMLSYFDQIQVWANAVTDDLRNGQEIDFFPYIKERTLDLALSMFLGLDYKAEFGQQIAKAFSDCVAGTLGLVRIPAFNTTYHEGIKGRQTLVNAFTQLVQQRRTEPKDDLISFMITAKDEDGSEFSDEQIVDHLIFTMMAAHDTTASSISSLIYQVTKAPQWQTELQQDADAATDLQYDSLNQLERTEQIFKETLRLNPPLVSIPRYLSKDIELSGYAIPAGTRTGVNIYDTHRDPDYWQNPEQFDPDRFARKEDKKHPYMFVPFGGGVHKCIGMHLSLMEAKILLRAIFRQLSVERTEPEKDIAVATVPIWHPKVPMRVRFKTRQA
ncbi:cytochrome P450 [Reinekea sp. G2M2-21]|uniref:cytochrome P450 n=1 Tax=Reinekea sp. G2M2-21 TaxID=2788942 RepID=UPI0018AC4A04|nr:cytochrome P450 [Reinekea sp. G2M2-21]